MLRSPSELLRQILPAGHQDREETTSIPAPTSLAPIGASVHSSGSQSRGMRLNVLSKRSARPSHLAGGCKITRMAGSNTNIANKAPANAKTRRRKSRDCPRSVTIARAYPRPVPASATGKETSRAKVAYITSRPRCASVSIHQSTCRRVDSEEVTGIRPTHMACLELPPGATAPGSVTTTAHRRPQQSTLSLHASTSVF
jgi:hypothetical protein